MSRLYVNNGDDVYVDPAIPADGGGVLPAAMIKPQATELGVNGAPVVEESHQLVVQPQPIPPGVKVG